MSAKRSSLLAVYDYTVAPPTFDYFNFLVLAEAYRRKGGHADIHLVFVPDDQGGFFTGLPFDAAERTWRLHNILIPGAALMSSVGQITICTNRTQAEDILADSGDVFPPFYNLARPIGLYEASELVAAWARGYEIPSLAAPEPARRYVQAYLDTHAAGRRVVTITLRQASYSSFRNSNVAAWARFAAALDPATYFPIFLPDMETLFDRPDPALAGFAIFGEATANVLIRAALYEMSFVNMMRSGGPGQMAYLHHDAPTIQFIVPIANSMDCTAAAIRSSTGINPGDQFPYLQSHQKTAWCDDTFDAITAEFAAFESFALHGSPIDTFKSVAKPAPRDVADLLARSGKQTQAQEILEQLLADHGPDDALSLTIAKIENERRDHAAALNRLDGLPANARVGSDYDEQMGDALNGLARRADAIAAYERALSAPDLNRRARVRMTIRLGYLLAGSGRVQDAERRAKEALSGAPDDRFVLQFLNEIWSTRGQAARAQPYIAQEIDLVRTIIAAQPGEGDDDIAARLGVLYVQIGRFGDAETHLRQLLAHSPMNWIANEALGDALSGLGRTEEAIKYFEAASTCSWDREPSPLLKLAHLRIGLNDLDTAERDIRRCIELAPEHGAAYEVLAHILMQQGRSSDSLQALLRARELAAR